MTSTDAMLLGFLIGAYVTNLIYLLVGFLWDRKK